MVCRENQNSNFCIGLIVEQADRPTNKKALEACIFWHSQNRAEAELNER